jgi:hypothetical protein
MKEWEDNRRWCEHLHDEIELERVEEGLVLGTHAQGSLQHRAAASATLPREAASSLPPPFLEASNKASSFAFCDCNADCRLCSSASSSRGTKPENPPLPLFSFLCL